MLYEFAPQLRVVMIDFDGKIRADTTLSELLPYGFGPNGME